MGRVAGWLLRAAQLEESPNPIGQQRRVTPGHREVLESATESKPPRQAGVRVKG